MPTPTDWLQDSPLVIEVGIQGLPGARGEPGTGILETPPLLPSIPLSALLVVAIAPTGSLLYADATNLAHAFAVVGLLRTAIGVGVGVTILRSGTVTDAGWAWTLGQPIFLGTAGQMTQTPPTTGFLMQVAIPLTATQITFELQEPILL